MTKLLTHSSALWSSTEKPRNHSEGKEKQPFFAHVMALQPLVTGTNNFFGSNFKSLNDIWVTFFGSWLGFLVIFQAVSLDLETILMPLIWIFGHFGWSI